MSSNTAKIESEFDSALLRALPSIRKNNKCIWTAPCDDDSFFYVMLDSPRGSQYGEQIGIYYGRLANTFRLEQVEHYPGQKEISFPYKLHKKLFAYFDKPFAIDNISYFRWLTIDYRKKLLYGNDNLTKYSIDYLIPHAIEQICREYKKHSS